MSSERMRISDSWSSFISAPSLCGDIYRIVVRLDKRRYDVRVKSKT